MAENQSHEKIKWHSEAAKAQVEPLIKHKGDWATARRTRQLEAVLVELSAMYPMDKENIILSLHGLNITKKATVKKKMVEVADSTGQVVKTGCDDCGDAKYRAKRITELESADEVLTYFNAAADESLALHRMNIFLRENGVSEVNKGGVNAAAKKVLNTLKSGKRIAF